MFEYRISSVVSNRSQAKEDITAAIHTNVSRVADLDGYMENCLLVEGGAEYYAMTEPDYSQLVHECIDEVIKNNS